MPALACVVTNQSCLVKQRRAVSDLNLVGGIRARGYEGTGAGEECQCQFSHVHLLSGKAPRTNVSTRAPVPRKSGVGDRHGTKLLMEPPAQNVPHRERRVGSFKQASTVLLFASQQILPSICVARVIMTSTLIAP